MLYDKCKEAFEKWYEETIDSFTFPSLYEFIDLPFQFQYGVYLEFFDSVGIYIDIIVDNQFSYSINGHNVFIPENDYKTRQEAQIEAIKKANDIFNAR